MSIDNDNIFLTNNPYGYRININHEKIRDKYERYRKWKKIPPYVPLSDKERFEFEEFMLKK